MNISSYLKILREKKKLSINQLALYSNVSAAHISRIERNLREPSPDILKKLSPYLDTNYEDLMIIAGYIDKPKEKYRENETSQIGTKLSKLRKEKSLEIDAFSKKLDIASHDIIMYESNLKKPTMEVIKKYSDYFNVTIDWLLGRTESEELAIIEGDEVPEPLRNFGITSLTVHKDMKGKQLAPEDIADIINAISSLTKKDT